MMHTDLPHRRLNPLPRWISCLAAIAITAAACTAALPSVHAQGAPGTVDTSYAPNLGDYPFVDSIAVRPDSRIIIGGQFSGVTRRPDDDIYIAVGALTSTGALDTTFQFYTNRRTIETGVSLAPDGKVYVTVSPAGQSLQRLNPDGSVDTGFTTPFDFNTTSSLPQILADGRLIVSVTLAYGSNIITRLNVNGSEDTSFQRLTSSTDLFPLVIQGDGKIVYNNAGTLARLNANGSPDTTFQTSIVTASRQSFIPIEAMTVQPDGKILVGGSFSAINGSACGGLARLNTDGSVDPGFRIAPDTDNRIEALTVQPDGKILVGGYFTRLGGVTCGRIVRLNADASLDASFNAGTGADDVVNVIRLLPDNDLLVGGGFHSFGGVAQAGLVRLHNSVATAHAPFFTGEAPVGNGVYYLAFPNGNYFGYYSYLADPAYIFHQDLGFEYVFDAKDGHNGVYFYDFKSNGFFYTSPSFPFPYLYDFSLNTVLYYYADPNNAGRYNTGGVRYFFRFDTGTIFSK